MSETVIYQRFVAKNILILAYKNHKTITNLYDSCHFQNVICCYLCWK